MSKTVKYIHVDSKCLTLYDIVEITALAGIKIYNSDYYGDTIYGFVEEDFNKIYNKFLSQKLDLSYDDKYAEEYKNKFGEKCLERFRSNDIKTLVLHYLSNKYDYDTIIEITEGGDSLTALLNYLDTEHLDLPPVKKEEELLICLDEEKYRDP